MNFVFFLQVQDSLQRKREEALMITTEDASHVLDVIENQSNGYVLGLFALESAEGESEHVRSGFRNSEDSLFRIHATTLIGSCYLEG